MKKKDPGYPGNEAAKKAVGEARRKIRLEKGLSLEEANALFENTNQEDPQSMVPGALGM